MNKVEQRSSQRCLRSLRLGVDIFDYLQCIQRMGNFVTISLAGLCNLNYESFNSSLDTPNLSANVLVEEV